MIRYGPAGTCKEGKANGALIDYSQNNPVDPAQIRNATLLIMGEKETDAAVLADRTEFFKGLGSHTKWFAVLSGLGKYATFERGRNRFEAALLGFLDQP